VCMRERERERQCLCVCVCVCVCVRARARALCERMRIDVLCIGQLNWKQRQED
jgi:hypothetical protein